LSALAEVPSFPLVGGRASALNLGVGLGLGYGPFALGAGVEVLATLSGRDVVASAEGAPSGVSDELLPAFGASVGASADLGKSGRIGLAFRSVLRADFNVDVAPTSLAGVVSIAPLNVQGIAHYEPLKFDAEYSRDFGPYNLVLGARYEHWGAFPGWLAATIDCPPGVACGTTPPAPPDYHDVVVPRAGLERTFDARSLSFTARVGYSFVPSAIPEQRGSSNTFDADRHAVGVGYRVHLSRYLPLDLDGAWRFDFLADRTHHKDDPTGPLGPEVTTHGRILTWSFAVRLAL
jgi:long-subunit fatty acid transport protein